MTDTNQRYTIVQFERPANGVYGYVGGIAITDEEIERLNANADAGFPGVTARPIGHPLEIGDKPSVSVQFRLDPDRLSALDALAAVRRTTRSELLRSAVDRELAAA